MELGCSLSVALKDVLANYLEWKLQYVVHAHSSGLLAMCNEGWQG